MKIEGGVAAYILLWGTGGGGSGRARGNLYYSRCSDKMVAVFQ